MLPCWQGIIIIALLYAYTCLSRLHQESEEEGVEEEKPTRRQATKRGSKYVVPLEL